MKKVIPLTLLLILSATTVTYAAEAPLGWRGNSFYKTDEDRYNTQAATETKKETPKRSLADIFRNLKFDVNVSTLIGEITGSKKEPTAGDIKDGLGSSDDSSKNADIISTAREYLGVPYVYGGSTPEEGFDCSGFVKYVYGRHGRIISRVTTGIMNNGTAISIDKFKQGDYSDLVPGDLMVNVDHVAMYTGDGRMIHAPRPGKVVEEIEIQAWWSNAVTDIRRIVD
ncbi:C40 family peptidase [Clostridium tertium]|uniref:C40 family peptidase n=1 Tax=Clostridium tertium TaxID=1559 RepID=UPI0023B2CCD0|nr:C40 family peptidase [Clostridium tertium]